MIEIYVLCKYICTSEYVTFECQREKIESCKDLIGRRLFKLLILCIRLYNLQVSKQGYINKCFLYYYPQVVEARKGYIRRVSSIRLQEIPQIPSVFQAGRAEGSGLYECIIVVGLNRDPQTGFYHPYVRDKNPPNVSLANCFITIFVVLDLIGSRIL